jgi:hypothetical protein
VRTWTFDQWEFEEPAGEESLEVSAASKSSFPFSDAQTFISAAVGETSLENLAEPIGFDSHAAAQHIRQYLASYCSIDIPIPCAWATYDFTDYDHAPEWEVVICTPTGFIRAYWISIA